tara:strand:+ start:98 stop:613 length:516 start_codon:yes stop_codon:yes gene_type:complete
MKYSYSNCEDKNFLDLWISNRDNHIKILKKYLKNNTFSQNNKKNQNTNNLHFYFTKRLIDIKDKKCGSEKELFIWIKKFEVHKRFYEYYCENKVKIVNSPLACLDTYLVFAECCLVLFKQKESYRYLSTFLKVIDFILDKEKATLRTYQIKKIILLIKEEKKIIKNEEKKF